MHIYREVYCFTFQTAVKPYFFSVLSILKIRREQKVFIPAVKITYFLNLYPDEIVFSIIAFRNRIYRYTACCSEFGCKLL